MQLIRTATVKEYSMAEYIFKLKKGELELELQSDDPEFIESQLENWREALLETTQND